MSLDIVAGAISSTLFFAKFFQIKILPSGLIALSLTVWIIYTADHLIDAKRIKGQAASERHRFHQKYFKTLVIFLSIAFIIDLIQLFFIRKQVFVGGIFLALIVAIYFLIQGYLKFLKELMGAILYTGGILLIPLSVKNSLLSQAQIILIVQFFVIALTNLILFSWFGISQDELDNHKSFATTFGNLITKRIVTLLLICTLGLSIYNFQNAPIEVLILVAMSLILGLILVIKDWSANEDRYRLLGDAIFLIPLIYVLIK
ncbi:MAG: hypothetical protein QM734_16170 [Cyclobacteriaceae bacterium]